MPTSSGLGGRSNLRWDLMIRYCRACAGTPHLEELSILLSQREQTFLSDTFCSLFPKVRHPGERAAQPNWDTLADILQTIKEQEDADV